MKLDCGISLQHEMGWDRHTLTNVRYLADIQEQPFLVYCEGVVAQQIKLWNSIVPKIVPVHDVGLNSLPGVLESLHRKGVRLNVTCKQHVETIAKTNIELKVDDVVFSSTLKLGSHLKAAGAQGIRHFAFSSISEINKIKKNVPDARLTLYMDCSEPANLVEVRELMEAALESGLPLTGLHLDSAPTTLSTCFNWVRISRSIVDLAAELGHNIQTVHLGDLSSLLEDHMAARQAGQDEPCDGGIGRLIDLLEHVYPDGAGVCLTACGSRFLVGSAVTLAARVIGVREKGKPMEDKSKAAVEDINNNDFTFHYYVNEGVFGAFAGCLWQTNNGVSSTNSPLLLGGGGGAKQQHRQRCRRNELFASVILGPSGDEVDLVMEDLLLPRLAEQDWLLFPGLGIGIAPHEFELKRAIGNGVHIFGKPNAADQQSVAADQVLRARIGGFFGVGGEECAVGNYCPFSVDLDTFRCFRLIDSDANNRHSVGEDEAELSWLQVELPHTNIFLSED